MKNSSSDNPCEARGDLKNKVARGVAWSLSEKIGTTLLQMVVSLVILRLLTRADLGVMAILTALSVVALVLVDSGFSQILIRKRDPEAREFTSVFLFNLAVSLLLYLLLVAAAPLLARYYAMPQLTALAPVFFLLLPVNALCSIQNTLFTRQFRFALLSEVTFVSWIVSGAVAIALALAGYGVWSIVSQRLVQAAVRTALLWRFSDWRPRDRFDGAALRRMMPYSFRLMATDLISNFYNKIPQFFLGRLYPDYVLGAFDQAVKLKDQPVTSTVQAVQNVTFPALSKISGDARRFAESYRQIVMVVAYLLFPVMMGLSAVAPDLFAVLLGAEWMQTVPYFEAVCLAGLCYPIAMIAFTVLKVRSDGRIILRIELWKKVMMTVVFAITIPIGVQAVIWGLVAIAAGEMAINLAAARRFTLLRLRTLFRTLLPIAAVTAAMYAAVRLTAAWLPCGGMLRLLAEIGCGAAVYLLLSALFRLEAFRESVNLARRQFHR